MGVMIESNINEGESDPLTRVVQHANAVCRQSEGSQGRQRGSTVRCLDHRRLHQLGRHREGTRRAGYCRRNKEIASQWRVGFSFSFHDYPRSKRSIWRVGVTGARYSLTIIYHMCNHARIQKFYLAYTGLTDHTKCDKKPHGCIASCSSSRPILLRAGSWLTTAFWRNAQVTTECYHGRNPIPTRNAAHQLFQDARCTVSLTTFETAYASPSQWNPCQSNRLENSRLAYGILHKAVDGAVGRLHRALCSPHLSPTQLRQAPSTSTFLRMQNKDMEQFSLTSIRHCSREFRFVCKGSEHFQIWTMPRQFPKPMGFWMLRKAHHLHWCTLP